MTIAELKLQRRWMLWKLESVGEKFTKVPYQSNGRKAATDDPDTWSTYADLEPHVHRFSGVGLILGEVDGVCIVGVDIDKCCDAGTRKFSPESREVVIGLNSYSEYSPSGEGAHVLCLGSPAAPVVK